MEDLGGRYRPERKNRSFGGKDMNRITLLALMLLALGATGCSKPPTWDDAKRLEKDGQFAPAVKAYDDFLKKFPETSLKNEALLSIARCEEGLGNYPKAVEQYQSLLSAQAGGELEIKAYLGLGNIYRDHLNDPTKALDAYERALSLYLNQADIRDAIKMLVDAKLQTADALYTRKDFQDSARVARAILQSYPDTYLATDSKNKAQSLVERAERSARILAADADQMFVVGEWETSPASSADFASSAPVTGTRLSPDGAYHALVRKQNGVPYLYLGKANKGKVTFRLVAKSTGVFVPEWSPRSDALIFVRVIGPVQKVERLDPKTGSAVPLFFVKNGSLSKQPIFDPSGSKVAYVYSQCLWVMNADGTNKTKLKTEKSVDPTALLAWSSDGTLLKYRTSAEKGKSVERIVSVDAVAQRP
jgi:hypothetical protein